MEIKPCVKCGATSRYVSGACKSCAKARAANIYAKDKPKAIRNASVWAKNNKDKRLRYEKKYKETHKEERKLSASLSAKKHRHKHRASNNFLEANRRARKKQATPLWIDNVEVKYIYKLSHDKGLSVDHIVPLTSDRVCGLHVQDNLRCIPKSLNSIKSNKYWPDM